MIKANELRSGVSKLHYLSSEGDLLICTIDWQDIRWCEDDNKGFNLAHTPIPLTEEILLKCGFEKDDFSAMYVSYKLGHFEIIHDVVNNTWLINGVTRIKLYITYLHQLQNLYFSLTNTELCVLL